MNKEALKFAGGAIIVAAAVCVMLPDLVRYVAGLGRLGIWIAGVLILAWILASVTVRLETLSTQNPKSADSGQAASADDETQSPSS